MPSPQNKKRIILCIVDGFGHRPGGNHVDDPTIHALYWHNLQKTYPWTLLEASGEAVGLPDGQMGNSEVGHMAIGLGRVVMQDLPHLNDLFAKHTFEHLPHVQQFLSRVKTSNRKVVHVMGLLSPGGVHAHENHIREVVHLLTRHGFIVYIHAFLDGRDTPPKSCLASFHGFQLATVMGRYFSMDRDTRWDRTQKAYNALMGNQTTVFDDPTTYIEHCYTKGITDEFIPPAVSQSYPGIQPGDSLWMVNFRADRVRQILYALLDPDFQGFERYPLPCIAHAIGMTSYSDRLDHFLLKALDKFPTEKGLGEWLSYQGKKQLRIAETEKYAHVTFFFNGGREPPYDGEDRILIPSPSVTTYDLAPAMSSHEITQHVISAMAAGKHDVIVMNYANADMVGHTGSMKAACLAIEALDACFQELTEAALCYDFALMITSDHGNVECMKDGHNPHTAHTCFPVPLLLVSSHKGTLRPGTLRDIAPTLLDLLGLPSPQEMTGSSLWISDNG